MLELIQLPRIDDERGSLCVLEHFPFPVRRIYYIFGVQRGATRGGHAHRTLHRWLIAVAGAFTVRLDLEPPFLRMDDPARALYVGPMRWLELDAFTPEGVCLVLASAEYDEADYIREAEKWRKLTRRSV